MKIFVFVTTAFALSFCILASLVADNRLGESKSELPELDFDSMFANSKSSSIPTIHANSEDGTVDIREFLGK